MNAKITEPTFASLLQRFLTERLIQQKNASPRTVSKAIGTPFGFFYSSPSDVCVNRPPKLSLLISTHQWSVLSSITWKWTATIQSVVAMHALQHCAPSSSMPG